MNMSYLSEHSKHTNCDMGTDKKMELKRVPKKQGQ